MAQVISVEKNQPLKPNVINHNKKKVDNKPPLFRKFNYILMGIGVILIIIGYLCLVGGGSKDPAQFNAEIFNTRRLVVSPILILLGLVTEIFAIMYHPRNKANKESKIE
ncbi:MAG: DUF3098 domain-containing protein [Bacteroidales bacterium]